MTIDNPPSIAIVGAGPGGLLAARVLQLGGVPVTVYDADISLESRDQGGTLDLHADSGQIAIDDAGLTDEFAALARPEGQAHRLLDSTGIVVVEQTPGPDETAAPEIDRAQLRRMLAESLNPGTIRWGRRVRSVGDGIMTFEDGATAVADLVIGADGAWSRVRAAVTDAVPSYTHRRALRCRRARHRQHPELRRGSPNMARQRRGLPGCCPVASETSSAARRRHRARVFGESAPGLGAGRTTIVSSLMGYEASRRPDP